ncbi:hypothetical protein GQ600_23820 [Phytophthora cactorum]|nr:hypothetical protein GQ600_23820 [Phytophthora cactorum]
MKEKQVAVLLVQDDPGVSSQQRVQLVQAGGEAAEFKGPKTSKTLKGQGRKELFPGVAAIVTYMKDVGATRR